MKLITNLDDINDVLNNYNGDTAKIWLFDSTHSKIALRITSIKHEEVIYLVMAGCQYIKGPFSWESPEIFVGINGNSEYLENEYDLKDNRAEFELKCNAGIALAKGLESEFGDSFENFLQDQ